MNILPSAYETADLYIRDATLSEAPALRQIFNDCSYLRKWDAAFCKQTEEAFVALVTRSLQRGDCDTQCFHVQSIYRREPWQLIGYYDLYLGVPSPELAVISMFVIHPRFQKHRFGTQAVAGLAEQLARLGDYTAIWLRVSLKNWPAVKFWSGCGFKTIVKYEGETVLSEGTHANLVLARPLR